MKKLKLELDTLRVQSFETAGEYAAARGTVRGNAYVAPYVGIVETDQRDCMMSINNCQRLAAVTIAPIVSTDDPFSCLNSMSDCGMLTDPY